MSREKRARALTLIVLLVALGVIIGRRPGSKTPAAGPEPAPQNTVYGMLDAARAGDVKSYVDFYTGQMQASVRQAIAEAGEAGFARYLKESNAEVKGVAMAEPQTLTEREVMIRVEYVYQDRNEAQVMYLERTAASWKIARVDGMERVKTLVPYGTPVR
jgi:hypothetical protein